MAGNVKIELSRDDAEHFASLNDELLTDPSRRLADACRGALEHNSLREAVELLDAEFGHGDAIYNPAALHALALLREVLG